MEDLSLRKKVSIYLEVAKKYVDDENNDVGDCLLIMNRDINDYLFQNKMRGIYEKAND